MTYVKQTWANGPAGLTPISAARLNYIESGIEVNSQHFHAVTDPAYGTLGSGNDTATLVAAITDAGTNGVVYFGPREYDVDVDIEGTQTGLTPLEGQTWIFARGAILNILPTSLYVTTARIINAKNPNVTITGLRVNGNGGDPGWNAGYSPDGIIGVSIRADNVRVIDAEISNVHNGDSVYISKQTTTSAEPEDIYLTRVVSESAGRMGIAIVGGRRVYLNNCTTRNSTLSGYQIEPQGPGALGTCADISLVACDAYGNGRDGLQSGVDATKVTGLEIIGGHYHTNTRDGISITGTNVRVTSPECHTNTQDGLRIASTSSNVVIRGGIYRNNTRHGVHVNTTTTVSVIGVHSHNNTGEGVVCTTSTDASIKSNFVHTNGLNGINIAGTADVDQNRVWNNANHGIIMSATTAYSVTFNNVFGNGTQTNITYDNIRLTADANDGTITGNRCRAGSGANRVRYGIHIANANCDDNLVENNDLRSAGVTANFNNAGTGTLIRANRGWVTENSGATSIADGGTVAHGLSTTPTRARVTTSVAGEFASVTGMGSSTLTIAIKKHDGTAGTTATVYWRAEA